MTDLSPYFDLIGYRHGGAPTLEALRELQLRHTHTIPFENLTPLAGLPVRLDLPSLLNKFSARRGGYCFEHNIVFRHALDSFGFSTRALLARVRYNQPPELITPQTHMLLMIELDGERWIADTGFGRAVPTAPLRLQPGAVQETPNGPYRVMEDEAGYRLEAELAGRWEPLYVFDLTPRYQSDFEMSNWYVSTHGNSHFVHDLVVVRSSPAGRRVIYNTRHSFYGIGAEPVHMQLTSVDAIFALLRSEFGIEAEPLPGLRTRIGRILKRDGAAKAPRPAARVRA
ncbi:hypothetical protein B0920_00640 [Massilia sp. KIM]|uniref:arylamine N-acetyltransferase family protein n=1 Tax=Massilia sp. KIM TaxID=1955422 RepID=UPI00098E9668|nr:arylamine N-acetyltransferase [Massilia sp. KIM]OON62037.1 hypothetical protein B0920_00640 [Massilia sp. KIM]